MSPHIHSVTERYSFLEGDIYPTELKDLFLQAQKQLGRNMDRLSYYEFLFYVFLSWAVIQRPKVLILEVGLGGALDSVNMLDADFVGLSSISRDHVEVLGKNYRSIFEQKWGVVRSKSRVFSALGLLYLRQLAKNFSRTQNCSWEDYFNTSLHSADDFSLRNEWIAEKISKQIANELSIANYKNYILPSEELPGRGQLMTIGGNSFILLGAHNLEGIRASLKKYKHKFHDLVFAPSVREVIEVENMMSSIEDSIHSEANLYFALFEHPKAFKEVENLNDKKRWNFLSLSKNNWNETFHPGKPVLVLGSYYFIHPFVEQLRSRESKS